MGPVLSLEDVTVTEGADVEFEVSLGAASGREVTVAYATADDTAEEPGDYTSGSGTLTFEAGDLAQTITVETEDDDLDEADSEQFKLTLSSASNATLSGGGATLQKLGKITDNDGLPVLSLEDVTVTEGADVEFEVSLGAASGREVTVAYATADDTADGDDYASASGTLTFEAGDTAKTITVTTVNDTVDEADTEQFKLTLSSAVNATLDGDGATLQKLGRITDNDGAPVLSLEDVTATEGADVEFEVSLGAASEQEVTVAYATADDTAEAPDDYASASGTLTFEAGDTAKTITVTTVNDTVDEADTEQFKLTLSSAANAALAGGQATLQKLGKITDNDGAPVLSLEDVTATEGADVEFEVSLGAASGREVTVSYATADDTADGDDYTSASGTLTFEAGDLAKTITVGTEDDDLDEADSEQFKLTLSSASNATLAGGQATLQKLGKITDNDGLPVLSLEDVTVTEGADVEFEVSLGAASEREVTVSYATADDTAKEPGDYASASGTLTFETGDLAKTITVTTVNDTVDEADTEQFKLTLSSASNSTLSGGQATLQKLGKIEDDDDPPELSVDDVTVTEGADVEFEVSLGAASEREVTVAYATADDTAAQPDDYASASGTLTFAAGDTAKTITVTTVNDTVDEADTEQFKLTLSSASNATLTGGGATLQKLGKIEDDDDPPELAFQDVTVDEDEDAEFVVSLDLASGREVTVSYATADDTAKQPADYTTASGTLTFAAGDSAKTITVTVVDDTVDEADTEQFKLTLSNAVNATLSGDQTTLQKLGKITDNDDPPVLSLEGETVVEGVAVEFEASLDTASEREVTVAYATADDTAKQPGDYASASGTLTFAAGDTAKTITVNTVDDALDEEDSEQFKLTLSNADKATLAGGQATLQTLGKITDNDDPPVLSVGDEIVTEGTAAEFEVSLDVESARQVTVSYATADDTAGEPDDYTSASGSLTFAAGDLAKVVTVPTATDSLNEADETFTFTLSSPVNATLDADADEADGTIEDDDELAATVTSDAPTVDEDESATFTVTLTGGTSTAEVVVDYSQVGSATEDDDYTAPSGKLTIEAEQATGQITIKTLEDNVLDRNETLEVRLDSATSDGSVEVSTTTAETRIIDSSDVKVTVKPAVFVEDDPNTEDDESEDSSVVEEGGTATFAVELSGAVGVQVLVPYETVEGSALSTGDNKDYTASSGTLTFAATETSKTIEITTLNDGLNEETETFEVRLTATPTSLPEGVTVAIASATVTVTDNDTLTVAVTADAATVTEDQSATFTVTLTGGTSTADVVVDYSLVGTATEDDDYTAPSGRLTIEAPDVSAKITIKTLQDNVLDRSETLEVELDAATTDGVVEVSESTAETTITDSGTVEVSITGLTVEEGDPPATVDKSSVEEGEQASFVVALSGPVEKSVEVSYATADGSGDDAATAGTDYTAANVTLTFASKETSKTVAVATSEDTDNEADETFTVTLAVPTGVTLPGGVSLKADATTATGTIENDDGLTATVKRVADNVPEGDPAEFAVELTGGTSTADVELTYTWASTGTADTDYTAPNGLLTITKSNSIGTIAIATLTDDVLDPGETLSVTLTGATTAIGTATVGAPDTATTTLVEEGTVTVSVKAEEVEDDTTTQDVNEYEDKSIVEEGGSASFVVGLSGTVADTVIVAYKTSNETGAGHASAGTDYTAVDDTLTFTSGESLTQTIAVTTADDNLNEATEKFTVTLTEPDPPGFPDLVSIATSSVQGTITGNDDLTAAVTALATSVDEGETAEFEVALTGGTSTAPVEVTYTVGGTATSGDDFTAPTDLTLTIGTGATSGTISIVTLTDTVLDGDAETLEVTLGSASSAGVAVVSSTPASMTISDTTDTGFDIAPEGSGAGRTALAARSVAFRQSGAATRSTAMQSLIWPEGQPVQFRVRLTGVTEIEHTDVVVAYVTSAGTAVAPDDYTHTSATLVFPVGEVDAMGMLLSIPTNDDDLNEGAEGFTVTLSTQPDSEVNLNGTVSPTIADNDPLTVAVTANRTSVREGESATFAFRVTESSKMTAPVVINYTVGGPVSTGGSGTVTIAVGDSTARTITVGTRDDSVPGPNPDLVVTLSATSAGEVRTGSARTSVEDDDQLTVGVTADARSVTEGDSATYTVRLSNPSSAAVQISYSVGGTATAGDDYTAPSGTLTIPAGDRTRKVTITTLADKVLEPDETLKVTLTSGGGATVEPSQATATTTIKEAASLTLTLDPDTVSESGETTTVTATVSQALDAPFEVRVSGTPVAPAVAGDFALSANRVLRFAAGATSASGSVTVTSVDNDVDTPNKTVTVMGTVRLNGAPLAGPAVAPATLTITDDDERGVMVEPDAMTLTPGDGAKPYAVRLNSEPTAMVTVLLTPSNRRYVAVSPAVLTFTPSTWSTPQQVDATALSAAPANAQVPITHMARGGDYTGESATVTVTIFDPPFVTIGDARVAEYAGELAFAVSLSRASTRPAMMSYYTVDGTARAGEDYVGTQGTLTVAAGATRATIRVTVLDDSLDEDDETLTVQLGEFVNAEAERIEDLAASGTIVDDDATPTITIGDDRAKESAGQLTFGVRLDAASGRPVAVGFVTEDGSATSGTDYGAADGKLTFEPGQTSASITIGVVNDLLEEPDEAFQVRLVRPLNAELPDAPAGIGTILDDDVSVGQVWLARFGRTVATHVVDAVSERLSEVGTQSSEVALAGHELRPAPVMATPEESVVMPFRALAGDDLIAGSSFRLASSAGADDADARGSNWTAWGRGAVTRLAGKEAKADLSLRGTIATGTGGVDYDWGGVLTGLAVAYSGGAGNFRTEGSHLQPRNGTADSWLVSAHPYARVALAKWLEVWGLFGYGLGMMSLTEDASVRTDIGMMMGAAGARGILLAPVANGGFGVAVRSDGFAMRANAEAAARQPEIEADAARGRLLLEGSYEAQLGDGSVLTPTVEAGMRYDAGHAEEGLGAELGGGMRYVKSEWGLTATANGRFVLAHQEGEFQEWGLRGSLQWSPGSGGLGPSLGLNSSWGTATSGVQRLWVQGATPYLAAPDAAPAGRLDARVAYGMSVEVLGTSALLTPFAGLTLSDSGTQAYRLGGRANLGTFSLSLEGERREGSGAAPAHGITLSGSLHW